MRTVRPDSTLLTLLTLCEPRSFVDSERGKWLRLGPVIRQANLMSKLCPIMAQGLPRDPLPDSAPYPEYRHVPRVVHAGSPFT